MGVVLDPAVAAAVSAALSKLGDTMGDYKLAEPGGFDWAQTAVTRAHKVIAETALQLGSIVGNIAANTADCARGFVAVDEATATSVNGIPKPTTMPYGGGAGGPVSSQPTSQPQPAPQPTQARR